MATDSFGRQHITEFERIEDLVYQYIGLIGLCVVPCIARCPT